jgi:hypothetical protein
MNQQDTGRGHLRRSLQRLAGVGVLLLSGAVTVLPASPAQAAVSQKCVTARAVPWGDYGKLCVSYNPTHRTAAANLQNCCAFHNVNMRLLSPSGAVLARWSGPLAPDEWKGILKSGVGNGRYCAESDGVTRVCL